MAMDEEKIQSYTDAFKAFDLDDDGVIDFKELEIGLAAKHPSSDALGNSLLQEIFKTYDANKDGVLQLDEFIKLMESKEIEDMFNREYKTTAMKRATSIRGPMGKKLNLELIYMQTSTPEESPPFIESKMAEFDAMLEKVPPKKKENYAAAKEKCPDETGREFKLVFLRCEVFDVQVTEQRNWHSASHSRKQAAVRRWIKYWDGRVEVFGDSAFLPMTLHGAMKDNHEALSRRHIQASDATDPDGRAILLADFPAEAGARDTEGLLRAFWYNVHVALKKESAQKRGCIFFIKSVESLRDWDVGLCKHMISATRGMIPVRFASAHYINSPTFFGTIVKIVKLFLGKKYRNRIYMHDGSLEEILESLSEFGLGKAELPDMFGGDLVFE